MKTPERVQATVRVQDYAKTGTDQSAGRATRAAALVATAVLLPWALFQRVLRSIAGPLRRAMSGLACAADLVRGALTAVVRQTRKALATVTRGPHRALRAVARGFRLASIAIGRRIGAALTALARWAQAATIRAWSALTPMRRTVAAALLILMALMSAWAGVVRALLRRCAHPFSVLVRGACLAVRWVMSVLRTVGRAWIRVLAGVLRKTRMMFRIAFAPPGLMLLRGACLAVRWVMSVLRTVGRAWIRVLAGVLRMTRMIFRIVLAPPGLMLAAFNLAARALVSVARRLGRRVAPVLTLVGRAALTIGRGLVQGLAATAQLASRIAATSWRATRRLLPRVLGPILWVSAVVLAAAHRRLTPLRRLMARVMSFGLDGLRGIIAAGSRHLTRFRHAWQYRTGRIAQAFAGVSRGIANGSRVAAGTARRRADRLAVAASGADWRLMASANGSPFRVFGEECEASFTLDVHENEFLGAGVPTLSAIISISSEIDLDPTCRPEMVELFLLDCSASMGHPWDKILHARQATRAAIAGLPDGAWFAVIRGAESAEVAYPRRGGLVRASDHTRTEAFRAIARLQPVGGTAIGRWLSLAGELAALRPGARGHALLLTDGKDEDESPVELQAALEACEGLFQCDCRGVGTDWAVEDLRPISTALLGTVDIIEEPAGMEADFRSAMERALSRGIEASIRLRTPVHAKVTDFRQVSPTVLDLTARARRIDAQTIQFGLGGWADERREYHLTVEMRPGPVGCEMAACRLAIVVGNRVYSSGLLRGIWTDDAALAARIDPVVAHYTGQAALAAAIQDGLRAQREGNLDQATLRLGRAVQLAASSGNTNLLSLLAKVVEVVDGDVGTVNLRDDVEAYDEMALDTYSTRTVPLEAASTAPGCDAA
jgi:hypothetical protein